MAQGESLALEDKNKTKKKLIIDYVLSMMKSL